VHRDFWGTIWAAHTDTATREQHRAGTNVQGHCPACGRGGLFVGEGGYITCPHLDCPEPDAASTLLERRPDNPAPDDGIREQYAAAIRGATCTGPEQCHESEVECYGKRIQPVVWHHGVLAEVSGSPEMIADAVHAVRDRRIEQLTAERDALASDLAELTQARQHGAFTFCAQLVGHVTGEAFARKIAEKRNALAQREQAVTDARAFLARAETAEADRDEARQHAAAIAAQRDRLRQRMNNLADRWEQALTVDKPYARTLRAEISCDPFAPDASLTVQPYRADDGTQKWAFRCWGTDTCNGWLGLGHHTETSALRERDRHVADKHTQEPPRA
jgi:hypothetical protein